jgi:hypothetical protein
LLGSEYWPIIRSIMAETSATPERPSSAIESRLQRLLGASAKAPTVSAILSAVALIGAAIVFQLPELHGPGTLYDEGLLAYGSVRVMDGQLPYRDFWSLYPPGHFYALALLFKLFGPSIIVERASDVVVSACLAFSLFSVAKRLSNGAVAFLAWAVVLLWLAHMRLFGSPIFAATLFLVLALRLLIRFLDHRKGLWIAGFLLGVAALFRHDLAAPAIAVQSVVLFVFAFRYWTDEARAPAHRAWIATRQLLPLFGGAAIVVMPVAGVFLLTVPATDLLQQFVTYPLTVYPRMRALPYPELLPENHAFYSPFPIYAGAMFLAAVLVHRARTDRDRVTAWSMWVVLLVGVCSFLAVQLRMDANHLAPFFLPALVLVPALWVGSQRLAKGHASIVSLLAFAILLALASKPANAYLAKLAARPSIAHDVPRAQAVALGPNQIRLVDFIRSHTRPDETIYSALSQHDRIIMNDAPLYFLAERHSATRYHGLAPGSATTLPVQTEIARALELRATKYVVICTYFDGLQEPNESSISSGVHYLDEYIARHYRFEREFGGYRVLSRVD